MIFVAHLLQAWHKPRASPSILSKISMSIRNFIGSTSALLLVWLGATYFREVPVERYPRQNSPAAGSTAQVKSSEGRAIAKNSTEEADLH